MAAAALLLSGGCTLTHQTFTRGTDYQRPPAAERCQFRPERDGFGFPNDTVREYVEDEHGRIVSRDRERDQAVDFSHGCFLMVRASMQFFRFARFDPSLPKLDDDGYRPLLKRLFRIPVWRPGPSGPLPPDERIVIPGYASLHDFSLDRKRLFIETIGNWRWTYMRVGNYRMGWPHPRATQALAARRLMLAIDRGSAEAVYLSRFPRMNHAVIVYDYLPLENGSVKFLLYDPNRADDATWLIYHASERYFELEKRWYFNEGRVNLMRIYLSPFH